jgi:CO/xanthine dehydrogenase Mo-binding subunit
MAEYSVINRRVPRLDTPIKARGRAIYVDDMTMHGMLHGVLVQSSIAHGKILNIDTSKAEKLPGVKAVITAKEAGLVHYGVSPARYDETLFCKDRVRYVGDEIAAVAAEDLDTAMEAASLIEVEYEELPAVYTVAEALAEGAPAIHQKFPNNIGVEVHQEFGDFAAALDECSVVKSSTFCSKRQDGGFIEPHAALANYDPITGRLVLYSSTQVPHYVMRTVAMVMGMPVGKVRVIKPCVGGGFGPKAECTPLDLSSSMLSRATGRPVKMVYTREQVFLHARARHQYTHDITVGFKPDGTLWAVSNNAVLDGGAYTSFGIATAYYAGSLLGGPYRIPNMKYDGMRVYTNKPVCGSQRGHGGIIARAGFEQLLDMAARDLGMDPADLRLKNALKSGDVTCNELNVSSLGLIESIEAVREASDWDSKKDKQPMGKGIGMACGFFVCGAGYPIYRSETYHSVIEMRVADDGGTIRLLTGSAELGQGSDTTMAMLAAETLGVKLEDISVESGDTNLTIDLGAYSSRQTMMTGHATIKAAQDIKDQIIGAVAEELGLPPDDIGIKDGLIKFADPEVNINPIRVPYIKEHRGWTDPPEGELTFKEAARLLFHKSGPIVGTGKYKPPKLGGSYKGAAVGTSPAYSTAAHVVEVSVDFETGQVSVDKVIAAHDCGRAINLTSVEGQMEGSVSMGLGEAMFEEVKFDDKGRVINANLGEYKIPTALDMPTIESLIVESDEPNGPFGAKEVGEGAILPIIPAILNAIYDATGVLIHELPLTPERVYLALKAAKQAKQPE